MRLLVLATLSMLISVSCQKDEGFGGDASVNGTVVTRNYSADFDWFYGEYEAADVWVHLVAADEINYLDRVRTNHEGKYEFEYLRPGNYSLYVYSRDSFVANLPEQLRPQPSLIAVFAEFEIDDRKESVDMEDINIYD